MAEIPPWRWLDSAPAADDPDRCRTRCADPLDTVHRCTKRVGHPAGHEWATERPAGTAVVPDVRERLARHLWIADAGSPATWDGMADGTVKLAAYNTATGSKIRMEGADVRARFLAEADAILAVIAGKEG